MSLRVLIVDDEPLARLRLRGLVEACTEPRAQVMAEAATAAQATSWLREHGCDLILLDVQMPGADGLQFAQALREGNAPAPAIVFVTAHGEHALRAFELEAADYLTKPVRRERLQEALARVARRVTERAAMSGSPANAGQLDDAQVVVVSDRGRLLRVPIAEVLYFKAELKYVTVRTAEQSLVMDASLSDLEQRLGERFLRVHRNALVARAAVRELQRHAVSNEMGELEADGGEVGWAVRIAHVDEWIAVSRRQAAAVREALVAHD
ncbi:LytR/AlgR family response regulator transcription factor [Burkholderiaceae bacterium UC74_6]